MVSALQTTLPGTDHQVVLNLTKRSFINGTRLFGEVPALVCGGVEWCLADSLAPLGLPEASGGWNGLFRAVHPGGCMVLDSYEGALGLNPGKLVANRHMLSEYSNMSGTTVIFVLDEVRRRRQDEAGKGGKDCHWGVMSALGSGLTIETIVLDAPNNHDDEDDGRRNKDGQNV